MMFGLKQLALLSVLFLSVSATKDEKKTTTLVGIENSEKSHGVHVPVDECYELDEDALFTISVKKHCRAFMGPFCTGKNTVLLPGDHSIDEPVVITSIYCHKDRPF